MTSPGRVAIVDHSLGNMFSVLSACREAGLKAVLTEDPSLVADADAVVLPGVGAFGDAMEALLSLGLAEAIAAAAASGAQIVGVCLGMQLLMSTSSEFGSHEGLGLISGSTTRFPDDFASARRLKVPQIGWNRIHSGARQWAGTLLDGLDDGDYMYFLHSYFVEPADRGIVLSTSIYGELEYCSTYSKENIFGCQYHPERSGPKGLMVYRNLARQLDASRSRSA